MGNVTDVAQLTGSWTSVEVEQSPGPLAEGTAITLQFDGDHLGAYAGGNRMMAGVELDDSRLVVPSLAETRMMPPPERAAQDRWVSAMLSAGPVLDLDGDDLWVTWDDGRIRFVKDAADTAEAPPEYV